MGKWSYHYLVELVKISGNAHHAGGKNNVLNNLWLLAVNEIEASNLQSLPKKKSRNKQPVIITIP
jgi:hypothetical protein